MTGVLAFIVVFGILVTVHELGHLIFAKRAGIHCPEFAIGMGPKIFSHKYNDTLYTIRLLPVGGYVRMASKELEVNPLKAGMRVQLKLNDNNEITHILLDDKHNFTHVEEVEVIENDFKENMTLKALRLHDNQEVLYNLSNNAYYVELAELEKIAPKENRFESKSVWKRFWTLFAGPLFNFLLALVLFTLLFYINGKPSEESIIGGIQESTPAAESNLMVGDHILEINDREVNNWQSMRQIIQEEGESTLTIKLENNGETRVETLTPQVNETELPTGEIQKSLIIGITPQINKGIFEPLWWGLIETINMSTRIFELVGEMFVSIFTGGFTFDMLNGPVGIYKVTETVATHGIITLMSFTAMLSVNLGIMNLLPIPALDGGRILFVLYEGIFRKPINRNVELYIQLAGALFIIIIMILVTWNDIKTFFL